MYDSDIESFYALPVRAALASAVVDGASACRPHGILASASQKHGILATA